MSTVSVDKNVLADDALVDGVMKFPMEAVVARYASEQNLPWEVAVEHEIELKRFLALCCLNPHTGYGMKGPIDELWHTFVIYTQNYARFCSKYARGGFIHHIPTEPGSESMSSDAGASYMHFLNDYERTFGHPAPPHLWPRTNTIEVTASCKGCHSCNGCKATTDPVPTVRGMSYDDGKCSGCSGCTSCSVGE